MKASSTPPQFEIMRRSTLAAHAASGPSGRRALIGALARQAAREMWVDALADGSAELTAPSVPMTAALFGSAR